jgi:outer membrane protein OmpA-like peptidoglycan-associated protein
MRLDIHASLRAFASIVLVALPHFLISQDQMKVERIRVIPETMPILNIHVDEENIKWVANTQALYKVNAKDLASEVPIPGGMVSLLQFPGGNADIRWSEETMRRLLGQAKITAAAYDQGQKILWIGTNGYGVFKFKTDPDLRLLEQLHIDNSKLRSDFINSVYVAKAGKVWIATGDGAVSIVGNQWTHHQKFFNIQRIRGRGNELWAIGDDLIWVIDNKDHWTPIEINRREIESEIHDIAVDKEGRIWIASNIMTSYRISNTRYQRFGPGQYFTSQFVNYVLVDDDATIWVGTNDKGLYIIEKESTITVTSPIEKYLDCNGSAHDAVISVRAVGGKPPYRFAWGHGTEGERLTQLGPAIYQLTVTDTEGSSKSASVEIPNPDMTLTATMDKPESGPGKMDGAATVKVQGGVSPYTYEWIGGLGDATQFDLQEGDYGITVTDAAGCSAITSVTIAQIVQPLSVSLEQKEFIRCPGQTTGVLMATHKGGKPPFTYTWSNGGDALEFRDGLVAGVYSVTITDFTGNTSTASITITEPPALTATIRIDSPASTNANDGAASVQCSGGTSPYQYNWDNGESSLTAGKLSPRRHTVTVTDASGCSTVAAVDISENILPLTMDLKQTADIRCAGDATAGLQVTIIGGKSPYVYRWNHNNISGDGATDLGAGEYSVTVTDAAQNTLTRSISIKEPTVIQVTTVAETPALSGKNEGHAIARAEGGTGRLSYVWDNGEQGQKTVSLSAGTHQVTVSDAAGCTKVAEVTIVEDFLALNVSMERKAEILCAKTNTGAIRTTTTGGKAPYTLSWNNNIAQNTIDPAGLPAGKYTVLVTDAAGNTVQKEITLTEPAELQAQVEILSPASANTADGKAKIKVSGGVGPFQILWSTGQTSAEVSTLPAGLHQVTVSDANNCQVTAEVNIREDIKSLHVTLTQTSAVSCSGQKTAALESIIQGGKAPFTYIWSDQVATQNRSALGAGTYTLTITDAAGQQTSTSVSVTQPEVLSGDVVDVRAATHERIEDGKATARISGGTTPYTFVWDNGETGARAAKLSVGSHAVNITDALGCTITTTVLINEKLLPTLTADNLEKGEAVRMEKLLFQADSASIDQSSIPTLEELYQFLYDNPTIVVEIGGHTNSLPSDEYCDQLSAARAKATADFIIAKGIDAKRLIYKGYGKRQPIATNMTPEGRRRNQRVEVKIVKLNE